MKSRNVDRLIDKTKDDELNKKINEVLKLINESHTELQIIKLFVNTEMTYLKDNFVNDFIKFHQQKIKNIHMVEFFKYINKKESMSIFSEIKEASEFIYKYDLKRIFS